MKLFIVFLLFLGANISVAETGDCQSYAEKKAKVFLESILKSEWGWDDINYVDTTVSLKSYKVVKNPVFNVQKHEDYVFEFKTASKVDAKYGLGSRFEVQMFANQRLAEDEFSCSTNSFRFSSLKEAIEL